MIKYFIRDDARFASLGIPSIREYIKQAQAIDPANLTPEHLFDLMDQVAVRRTRKFVKEHYANELIIGSGRQADHDQVPAAEGAAHRLRPRRPTGSHSSTRWSTRSTTRPTRTRPVRGRTAAAIPKRLMLARYLSSMYTVDHDLQEYQISNAGLLRSGLLKRLESSPQALHASLEKMIVSHEAFLGALGKGYVLKGEALSDWVSSDSDDLDEFVAEFDKRRADRVGRRLPPHRARGRRRIRHRPAARTARPRRGGHRGDRAQGRRSSSRSSLRSPRRRNASTRAAFRTATAAR